MSNDTIYRQAAIEALKGLPTWWADEGGYYDGAQPPMVALLDPEDAVSAIENLPSAQTWIPITERMPEEDEECLVTYDAEIVGAKIYPVSERIYPELVWWGKGKWTDRDGLPICVNVTAWMPKPEPYRGK